MGMNADNKGLVFTILAIIGGIVVLGWLLKFTLNMLGPLLLIGIAVAVYLLFFHKKGPR
jgi:predicted membrane chloride channel (bestrophin family)